MSYIVKMQSFVQEYAETIAEILEIDVSIIDEQCVRICGTGLHQQTIGQPVPHGSFFRKILETGKPGIISDVRKEFACQTCINSNKCQELATIGFPIFKRGKPIGVIGIIAFTEEQRRKIVNMSPKLWNFLKHMSTLLESKLLLLETNTILHHQVQEAMNSINEKASFRTMVGADTNFLSVVNKAKQVAPSTSTVLIRGESGTGKELLARAIHGESSRSKAPFVVVNCASIPENLLESELFGYEGGTFTGANKQGKIGKFEMAHNGTIFLDEIGDMPLSLQPKLLRVLQEKTVDRIGGRKPISVDVRVVAATHRDLEAMVEQGAFRKDLYYRINVIPLVLPSLRERPDDITLYLGYFLNKYCKMLNKGPLKIDPALQHWLRTYNWPGNIRQLENVVEYMVNMADSEVITREHIPEYLTKNEEIIDNLNGLSLQEKVQAYEKCILQNLIKSGSSTEDKIRVARQLKISLATLYRKMEKYQLI